MEREISTSPQVYTVMNAAPILKRIQRIPVTFLYVLFMENLNNSLAFMLTSNVTVIVKPPGHTFLYYNPK
jgi:hypothetical protein